MKYPTFAVSVLILGASLLNAAPAPLPETKLGLGKSVYLDYQIATAASNGGLFDGYVDYVNGSNTGFETRFWCVDSQNTFNWDQKKTANLIRLDDSNITSNKTQYGTLTSVDPTPAAAGADVGWTNNLGAGYNSASVRYTMAAWLVTQYVGFNGTISTTGANATTNSNIQKAIWAVIHNSENMPADGGTNAFTTPAVASWITQAKTNYVSIDKTKWAVVSWLADASGTLLSDDKQTFLVQVVPEPGFYGVLALGLSGIFLAVRRRKQ